jgi:cytochrome c oxidase subunit 4
MSERNLTHDQQVHVESHAPYMRVFWILLVFTIMEYLYAAGMATGPFLILVGGLMFMAIFKATMVGRYFMHLKYEGRWVYGFLIPAAILAVILTVALLPDVAMQPVTEENPDVEGMPTAPVQPGPAAAAYWVRDIVGCSGHQTKTRFFLENRVSERLPWIPPIVLVFPSSLAPSWRRRESASPPRRSAHPRARGRISATSPSCSARSV